MTQYYHDLRGRTVTVMAGFGHWVEPESHLKISQSQKAVNKNFRSHPFIHESPAEDEWMENNAYQMTSDV